MGEIVSIVQSGGAVAITVIVWWLERKERLKLERRLEECLKRAAGYVQRGKRGR